MLVHFQDIHEADSRRLREISQNPCCCESLVSGVIRARADQSPALLYFNWGVHQTDRLSDFQEIKNGQTFLNFVKMGIRYE